MQQQSSEQSNTASQPRKPYVKPSIEVVQLRVKEHVMAVCKTNSSATSGTGCTVPVTQCFS